MKLLTHGMLKSVVCCLTLSVLLSCSLHEQKITKNEALKSNSAPKEALFVSNQDGDREIYLTKLDGTGLIQLTNNSSDDYEASWSPLGDKIVFTSNRIKGNTEVYLMNADGSSPVNISNSPGFDGRASWSPDGEFIAFNSARSGVEQIFLWHRSTGAITQITDSQYMSSLPTWSPDGKWIAYQNFGKSHKADLWITSVDGAVNRQLTSHKKSEDGAFDWSPDSTKIAFHSRRDYRYNLYVYDLNLNQEFQLTHTYTSDVQPKWSASGDVIMFMSNRGQYGRTQICLMQEDGTEQRCITDSRYQAGDPTWLNDNSILHSNWNGKRFSNIYLLDLGTEQLIPLAPAIGYQSQPIPRPELLPNKKPVMTGQQLARR